MEDSRMAGVAHLLPPPNGPRAGVRKGLVGVERPTLLHAGRDYDSALASEVTQVNQMDSEEHSLSIAALLAERPDRVKWQVEHGKGSGAHKCTFTPSDGKKMRMRTPDPFSEHLPHGALTRNESRIVFVAFAVYACGPEWLWDTLNHESAPTLSPGSYYWPGCWPRRNPHGSLSGHRAPISSN